jgi:DNA topoisomerase-6 subunit B
LTQKNTITSSSTAEYFAKNLQQVGFSSPTKAVLTTLKEALDNALDACEEHHILPDIHVYVRRLGRGNLKNTDRVLIGVEDNGPGLTVEQTPMVFGEYLASSKFGRGRCSRGQQGIGISAATTWAVQTSATGARVLTKTKGQRLALSCMVATDYKNNKGIMQEKQMVPWEKPHGTRVEFVIDGRVQLNGEAGLITYLRGNVLLNPHLSLTYELPEMELVSIPRVSEECPVIPEAMAPHPHTMKLGEFISHARLFGRMKVEEWLCKEFSRMTSDLVTECLVAAKLPKALAKKTVESLKDEELQSLYQAIQQAPLQPPSTKSVMAIGEDALSISIQRLGDVDYFSVVSRKPSICDFKPVQVEIAVARLSVREGTSEEPIQVLRFANRVPLQFDKASCAIVKAITSVQWRAYGLKQAKNALPVGPYIVAVSVVSPFIKFKNASKETIDASDELVLEIRKGLMKAGQELAKHLNRESRAKELEDKKAHIEQFAPALVDSLCRILQAPDSRRHRAEEGLKTILGRDDRAAQKALDHAEEKLSEHMEKQKKRLERFSVEDQVFEEEHDEEEDVEEELLEEMPKRQRQKLLEAREAEKEAAAEKKSRAAAKKTAKKTAQVATIEKKSKVAAAKKSTKKKKMQQGRLF